MPTSMSQAQSTTVVYTSPTDEDFLKYNVLGVRTIVPSSRPSKWLGSRRSKDDATIEEQLLRRNPRESPRVLKERATFRRLQMLEKNKDRIQMGRRTPERKHRLGRNVSSRPMQIIQEDPAKTPKNDGPALTIVEPAASTVATTTTTASSNASTNTSMSTICNPINPIHTPDSTPAGSRLASPGPGKSGPGALMRFQLKRMGSSNFVLREMNGDECWSDTETLHG